MSGTTAPIRPESVPGQLGLLYLVIRIRVPWHRTSEQLPFGVRILDADRSPVDPARDPAIQGAVEVGRPPGARAGDELSASLVLPLAGFPVLAAGTLFFHVLVAGETLGVLPLKVAVRAPFP